MVILSSLDVIPITTPQDSCFQQFLGNQGSETLGNCSFHSANKWQSQETDQICLTPKLANYTTSPACSKRSGHVEMDLTVGVRELRMDRK